LIGSAEVSNTTGIVVAAALAVKCRRTTDKNYRNLAMDQIGHQCREPIDLIVRPAVIDRDILAFDVTCFMQTSAERGRGKRYPIG
jgi:hypothetical protein